MANDEFMNVQLRDEELGVNLNPATLGSLVKNNAGANLGSVEAGAQVNKIEKIKYGDQELTITSKTVTIPEVIAAEYSLKKLGSSDTGYDDDYSAQYVLTKDGVAVGDAINIAKDMVVQSGEVKVCSVADQPVAGYEVGDKYIDLLLANSDNQHIYILVSDLVDTYTGGNGITITGQSIAIDTSVVATQTDLATKQPMITNSAKLDADLVDDSTSTNKFVTEVEKTAWNNKQEAISDLGTIRSNAQAGKGAADTIATYGNIVTHNTSEFQSAISATNKLNSDFVDDTNHTNKFVTETEKSTWNAKQDAISDLATIRSGAAAGATALQSGDNVSELTNDAQYVTATVLASKKYISYTEIV